jgi:8-oxo-dGTP diphosphatase
MTTPHTKPVQEFPLSTLCLFLKGNQILLAMKKRGFGKGKWNGVGGKVLEGESVEQAAVRESYEEIRCLPRNVEKWAIIDYLWPHKPECGQQVHIFLAKMWEGEPQETEEMCPKWFDITQIPYNHMWSDDIHWLPIVLLGKRLKGRFVFDEREQIIDCNIMEVHDFTD